MFICIYACTCTYMDIQTYKLLLSEQTTLRIIAKLVSVLLPPAHDKLPHRTPSVQNTQKYLDVRHICVKHIITIYYSILLYITIHYSTIHYYTLLWTTIY